MKTITRKYKVYTIDELSEEARAKALEKLYDINLDYDWWEYVYEDAKTIGLAIDSFNIDRGAYCDGTFINGAMDTINLILKNHGEKTETYKTATQYEKEIGKIGIMVKDEDEYNEKCEEFLQSLLEDYRIMLQKEYEFMTSEEAILDTIKANEYTFLEDGTMFN